MKVLITGSRSWQDWASIYNLLSTLPQDTVVVHGAARGADRIAGHVAKACGLEVREYPANWTKHGKAAGPIRNIEMLEKEKPDIVFAYPLPNSIGTRHCMIEAEKRGILVVEPGLVA